MKTVLIAGAGIIGLSTALELALRGVDVTVLERGTAMREASWAAAGMLAANDPENPPLLAPLSHFSLSLYPEFLSRIEGFSGCRIPLRTSETLQVCRREHTPADTGLLSREEALRRVPGISPALQGDLLWLKESSLDPRDLCQALPGAVRAAGVRVIENCPVNSIHIEQDHITAGTSGDGKPETWSADSLVICCGAWSLPNWSPAAGVEQAHLSLCWPRKGQMLCVRLPTAEGSPVLQTVLRSSDVYLVPRGDEAGPDRGNAGRIIVGATVEDCGFDRSIRPHATEWLMEKACALWPPIRNAQIEDVWTGIRPGTMDGLPLIGPASSAHSEGARVWIATGHYRNGILLAPGTARALALSMLEQPSPIDLEPFRPTRTAAQTEGLTPAESITEPQGAFR